MDHPRELVVGVDLGGTKIAAAVVGPDGAPGPVRRRSTPAQGGPGAVLDAVAAVVREVLKDDPAEAVLLTGLGIGAAGVVDFERGVILSATESLVGWAGTDVVGGLAIRLAEGSCLPRVLVQNDVDAHGSGEAWVGAAAGSTSALLVAVGTGIGGSWLVAGRPWRGSRSVAGEIGHVPAPGAGHLRCACGRMGHVEAIGAGPGLYRHYLSLGGDRAVVDARGVVARASSEPVAGRAVEESASAVGRAVAGLVTTLDPQVVVIGGGLPSAGEVWWRPFETTMRAELIDVLTDVPVLAAQLGETAAVIGAARPVWEEQLRSSR